MFLKPFASLCVILAWGSAAPAAFIVNGSFENPAIASGSVTNYPGGSNAITGWTVVGVDSAVVNNVSQYGVTYTAQDGNQFIDLAGVNSNSSTSGVTQTVTTILGNSYDLQFYVGSATDGIFSFAATVDLSIDGGPRMSFTNPTTPPDVLDWRLFSHTFTASGTSTNITFFNGSAPSNFLSALDNVTISDANVADVSGVPLPPTVLFAAVGGVALMLRRRSIGLQN